MTELSVHGREYATSGTGRERLDLFDEAFTTFYPQIVAYLRRRVAADDVEDIAQDALTKVYEHLDDYEKRGSVGGWLMTIAKHSLVDHYRRKGRKPVDLIDDNDTLDQTAPGYGSDPATTLVLDYSRDEALAAILATVSADQAAIFSLMIDGYTRTEISEILGISRVTIKNRVHRGRETLISAGILPPK